MVNEPGANHQLRPLFKHIANKLLALPFSKN